MLIMFFTALGKTQKHLDRRMVAGAERSAGRTKNHPDDHGRLNLLNPSKGEPKI